MNTELRPLRMPLIALVAINLLPSLTLRPFWFTAFAVTLVSYRLWLEISHRPMPPRWAQWVVQGAVALAVWQHYHSVFGDEAAGTWLTLLTCLKLFELRSKRDYFLTALLCFMVLMSALLLDQSLSLTAFLIFDVVLITGYLFALEEEKWEWSDWRRAVQRPLFLFLRCLPLLAITFVLFPRFSTGFGTGEQTAAKMGMTDRLQPGAVSNLMSSDELIFRATFLKGDLPARASIYWRGAILDQMQGLNWSRSAESDVRRLPTVLDGQDEIEIYLEPGSERFLFSLEGTRTVNFPNDVTGNRAALKEGGIFELAQPLQVRERYFLQSGDAGSESKLANGSPYLQVHEPPGPELKKWLAGFQGLSASETVRRLAEYFKSGGYTYSLTPPAADTLEDFLFKTKTGFCEHYAATFASALRYLGVPARVVVGFQGGNPSFLENYISVRAHDAHAWVEYYQPEASRWRRVDPTVLVAPQRITLGDLGQSQWMPAWVPSGWGRSYLKARAFFDEVEASWIGFLMRFDLARQKELLAKLGMESVMFRALPVFLVLAIALFMALLYFFESQGREQIPAEERLYRELLAKLKRLRWVKAANEGPLTLMSRIASQDALFASRLEPILAELVEIRFGGATADTRRLKAIKKRISQLAKN